MAIFVLAPLLAPIAEAYGYDKLLFEIIMILNLEIGYLRLPVGFNLAVAMTAFKQPFGTLYRAALPFIGLSRAGARQHRADHGVEAGAVVRTLGAALAVPPGEPQPVGAACGFVVQVVVSGGGEVSAQAVPRKAARHGFNRRVAVGIAKNLVQRKQQQHAPVQRHHQQATLRALEADTRYLVGGMQDWEAYAGPCCWRCAR